MLILELIGAGIFAGLVIWASLQKRRVCENCSGGGCVICAGRGVL